MTPTGKEKLPALLTPQELAEYLKIAEKFHVTRLVIGGMEVERLSLHPELDQPAEKPESYRDALDLDSALEDLKDSLT